MAGGARPGVRHRKPASETGQIEGLYTLKAGITERLVAEGLAGVVRSHTVENVEDRTIKGLLADQETAYNMLFEDVASGRPLTQHAVKTWHQLVTRHQETVAGLAADGRRVQVPFRRKGMWKNRPNNPRRPDGVMHEYCPPEVVQDEMDRFFALLHAEVERERYRCTWKRRGCTTASSARTRSKTATAACRGCSWPMPSSAGASRRR